MKLNVRSLLNLTSDHLHSLPLVVLYITDGCNSRCATCDIWKLPRRNMDMGLVDQLASEFPALGVQTVVLSGGEAMQHPQWPVIAEKFRSNGLKILMLTNGLALKKQAQEVIDHIDLLTVSLDGATRETYKAIRGVDALPTILEGMQQIAAAGIPITTRTTIQKANYHEIAQIVDVAKAAGVSKVSFLAVDVSNTEAFGPRFPNAIIDPGLELINNTNIGTPPAIYHPALTPEDLPLFAKVLDRLEQTHAADFASGLIAESPQKLRRLHHYFEAVNGSSEFDGPRCNAPHISTVIEVDGTLRPCYFLPAMDKLTPKNSGDHAGTSPYTETVLSDALNSESALALRKAYRNGERPECARCVCPLYRGPRSLLRGM